MTPSSKQASRAPLALAMRDKCCEQCPAGAGRGLELAGDAGPGGATIATSATTGTSKTRTTTTTRTRRTTAARLGSATRTPWLAPAWTPSPTPTASAAAASARAAPSAAARPRSPESAAATAPPKRRQRRTRSTPEVTERPQHIEHSAMILIHVTVRQLGAPSAPLRYNWEPAAGLPLGSVTTSKGDSGVGEPMRRLSGVCERRARGCGGLRGGEAGGGARASKRWKGPESLASAAARSFAAFSTASASVRECECDAAARGYARTWRRREVVAGLIDRKTRGAFRGQHTPRNLGSPAIMPTACARRGHSPRASRLP
jgi:hypothetical protein